MHHQYKHHLYFLTKSLISCPFYFVGYLDDFQNNLPVYSAIPICFSYETCFIALVVARASKAHRCQILALETLCLMEKQSHFFACLIQADGPALYFCMIFWKIDF